MCKRCKLQFLAAENFIKMTSSPSPDDVNDDDGSVCDVSVEERAKVGDCGGVDRTGCVERGRLAEDGEGRGVGGGGENYETTADIDLQLLEELGRAAIKQSLTTVMKIFSRATLTV